MHKRMLILTIVLFLAQLGLFLWITLRPFTISPSYRSYYILRGQGAYTAFIRQAKDGAWALYNPYTTRSSPAIYVHVFYVFLGKIAALFSLDPVYTYMVTRIVAGAVLFMATFWFIRTVVPAYAQMVALLFALGIEPGPLLSEIKKFSDIIGAPPAIFSYFPQEVALRHFGLPHHVLAEALGLFLLGNIFLYVKKQSWHRLTGIAVLTLIGAFLMPAYNGVIVLTVLIAWTIWALSRRELKHIVLPFATVVFSMAAVAVFTKIQTDTGSPWKDFNIDEKRWVTDSGLLMNYLSSLLLYLPGVVALVVTLPRIWRRMETSAKLLVILLTSWIVGPLLYIPLTHLSFFPFANFRLVDGYAYVPAAIVSALGVYGVAEFLKKRWIVMIGIVCIAAASLLFSVSYTMGIFAEQQTFWMNVYPYNDEWAAVRYLTRVPAQSGVLVMKYFGEIIPAYATVRVFLGETPGQIDWPERYFEAIKFYSGTLSDTDARAMLEREHISYVWWGQDEQTYLSAGALYPNILVPVFRSPIVTIFEVGSKEPR